MKSYQVYTTICMDYDMESYKLYSTTKSCTDVLLTLSKQNKFHRRNVIKSKTLL